MDISFLVPTSLAVLSLIINYIQGTRIKTLERENQEYLVIRKLQFETEFKCYQELFQQLTTIALNLVPEGNANVIDPNSLKVNSLMKEVSTLSIMVHRITPFISVDISNPLGRFYEFVSMLLQLRSSKESFKMEEQVELFQQFQGFMAEVEASVRTRIRN